MDHGHLDAELARTNGDKMISFKPWESFLLGAIFIAGFVAIFAGVPWLVWQFIKHFAWAP